MGRIVNVFSLLSLKKGTIKRTTRIANNLTSSLGYPGLSNGGSEKTPTNSWSLVFKHIGDFDYFNIAAGFVIG